MTDQIHRVVIVGSGPAGLTAALYTARADLHPMVYEGHQPGGQLTTTTDVENYPGFPEGIMGPEMMNLFRKQAQRFGAVCEYKDVTDIDVSQRPFTLTVDGKHSVRAQTVIIATGASALYLGLSSEQKLLGHGVSACATCDGFFFRDKELVVVGGGDSAMEEGTFLTKFATKVSIVHRRDEFRASKIMLKRAQDNPKVDFITNAVVTDVLGTQSDGVSGVKLKSTKNGKEWEMPVQGMFLAIGHKPNSEFLHGKLDMDENGYVKVHNGTYTSVNGIFACGDVMDRVYRQAVTAAGSGCMAAIDAERFLEAEHG